ncbi:hypothetical protein DFR29_110230 [Tahibacter aquaticus]|uniref:DUF1554 domain-containing protein n=1 Tax=Tahibacter aquaticus TaxID=520092 RepID=A0A4R6YTT0_9GAMM|nr:hypothetical protein [Tahibacter aquaticus]TDR41746.1 hypothetical protein DFR29_110230 [Tahibacter aquaticus]
MNLLIKRGRRFGIASAILLAASASAPALAAKQAFVTSIADSGILGNWADAGGNVGLAAGDAICVARATAANLPNPGDYVAWLSDSTNDAYCRIHGFNGTKANLCGQATLPAGAGPWQRVDGTPFMAVIERAIEGDVYMPLSLDEFGATVNNQRLYTGTTPDGTVTDLHCGNWLIDDDVRVGSTSQTYPGWTQVAGRAFCNSGRLACMQKGAGPALSLPPSGGKQAFITRELSTGNLGTSPLAGGNSGLAAADAICRNSAQAANLYEPQSYKAYIAAGSNPAARFQNDGPWFRLDGVRFADDFAQISSGFVRAPLNLTETGLYRNSFVNYAWTGVDNNGSFGVNCSGWNASSGAGWTSLPEANGPRWPRSYLDSVGCSLLQALYCLSDSDLLFRYGFD